jgi:hypothetical protein
VVAIESNFNPFAQSAVGAQGLMQVMTRVHNQKYEAFGGTLAAFDPVSNLRVGVQVLRECISGPAASRPACATTWAQPTWTTTAATPPGCWPSRIGCAAWQRARTSGEHLERRGGRPTEAASRATPLPNAEPAPKAVPPVGQLPDGKGEHVALVTG